jgi:DNA-binding response OmpR family regulator
MARTILIIDDRPEAGEAVRVYLADQGYHALVAPDADTGWEAIFSHNPEILVLGLALPESFALLRRIRERPDLNWLAVIAGMCVWAQHD